MAKAALGRIPGSTVVHYMINAALACCGSWSGARERVTSVPEGCRMCKRCSRRDGLSLECGCDISGAMLRRDGVTAFCARCEQDVTIVREAV